MVGVGRVALPRVMQDECWKVHARGVRIKDAAEEAGVDYETAREWVTRAGGIRPRRRQWSGRFLSLTEREEIAVGLAAGLGVRAIARRLGRSPSTVSREVSRNRQRGRSSTGAPRGSYRAVLAQGKAEARARRPKPRKLSGDAQLANGSRSTWSGDGHRGSSPNVPVSRSPMMSACVSPTRRSTSRCWSRVGEACARNCTRHCGPVARSAGPGAGSATVGGVSNSLCK